MVTLVDGGTVLLMSVTGIDTVMADGGMSECAGGMWNTEDDILVRHLARKMSLKEFGLLKACTEVLERYDEWWKELPSKLKLKENVIWLRDFERKVSVWKTTNIKFLNLKESKAKDKPRNNSLLSLYEEKRIGKSEIKVGK